MANILRDQAQYVVVFAPTHCGLLVILTLRQIPSYISSNITDRESSALPMCPSVSLTKLQIKKPQRNTHMHVYRYQSISLILCL